MDPPPLELVWAGCEFFQFMSDQSIHIHGQMANFHRVTMQSGWSIRAYITTSYCLEHMCLEVSCYRHTAPDFLKLYLIISIISKTLSAKKIT